MAETERLLKLEEVLHTRMVNQEEAVSAVARAVRRARSGLKDPRRPVGSFIFLGPSGVGKTYLAKTLAEALFGDEEAMVRVDMSEYMERHNVSRLVGAPPGYVGYEEGGQLTEAVRRKPYSVVLLDEIEKAHTEAFNLLLQILEDGRLTDAQGRVVDFKNTVVIMTANVGAHLLKKDSAIGFRATAGEASHYEAMKEKILDELKRTFRPEFLNRVDEIIVFQELTEQHLRRVVDLMLEEVGKRLKENNLVLEVTDRARERLAREGADPLYGARPLRRSITRLVEDPLSEEVIKGSFQPGDTVVVDFRDEGFTFEARRP
jgi:ATP-dependent Clp protease ATP-binding subunit ClpC